MSFYSKVSNQFIVDRELPSFFKCSKLSEIGILLKSLIFCVFSGLLCAYDEGGAGHGHHDYQSANMAMIKMQTIVRKMAARLREAVSVSVYKTLPINEPLFITTFHVLLLSAAGKFRQTVRDPKGSGNGF